MDLDEGYTRTYYGSSIAPASNQLQVEVINFSVQKQETTQNKKIHFIYTI